MNEWKEFNLKSNNISTNQGFLQILALKNDFKYGTDLKVGKWGKGSEWHLEVRGQGVGGAAGRIKKKIWNGVKLLNIIL